MAGKFKKILASLMFITPATAMAKQSPSPSQKQSARTEVVKTSRQKVKYDKFAKYRSAEKAIMQQLVFFEGCVDSVYDDGVGVKTIGIGSTKHVDGTPVKEGDVLKSNAEVKKLMLAHLEKRIYPFLDKYITRRLSVEELASVVSICYNCGAGILGKNGKQSDLARAINQNNKQMVTKTFLRKVSTKKEKFNNGLAKRRALELYCYLGKIRQEDIMIFYVGGVRALEVDDVLKKDQNGEYTILKSDEKTINKVKRLCMQEPDAERAKKTAWYGGDRRVYEFINLGGSTVYYANIVRKMKSQNNVSPRTTNNNNSRM